MTKFIELTVRVAIKHLPRVLALGQFVALKPIEDLSPRKPLPNGTSKEAIYQAIAKKPQSYTDLASLGRWPAGTVASSLWHLRETRRIHKGPDGTYAPTRKKDVKVTK